MRDGREQTLDARAIIPCGGSCPGTSTLNRRAGPLIVLTIGAASTDALSYLGLGHVFPANMTGNTVLLATGTATADYASAIRSLLALGGFLVGAFGAGLAIGARPTSAWTDSMRAVLVAELAVQLAALGWWLTLPAHPHGDSRLALIGMFGATMGMQSAVVARLRVGVSTTYITGTWTAVSTWAAGVVRRSDEAAERSSDTQVQVPVLLFYFGSALAAGYLFGAAGGDVAAIPAGAVAVVSLALALSRGRWR